MCELGDNKSVSREFSRQVDIPPNIDPLSLRSTLSNDGILQVIIVIIIIIIKYENNELRTNC